MQRNKTCTYCSKDISNKSKRAMYCNRICKEKNYKQLRIVEIKKFLKGQYMPEKETPHIWNFDQWHASINARKREGKTPAHKTPKELLDKGMAICSMCGSIISVDNKYCKVCKEETIILT